MKVGSNDVARGAFDESREQAQVVTENDGTERVPPEPDNKRFLSKEDFEKT